jgi:hypothetical protein
MGFARSAAHDRHQSATLGVTERVLNHTGRARSGVAGVYHLYDYAKEKRLALAAWENHIRECIGQVTGANVTGLRKI